MRPARLIFDALQALEPDGVVGVLQERVTLEQVERAVSAVFVEAVREAARSPSVRAAIMDELGVGDLDDAALADAVDQRLAEAAKARLSMVELTAAVTLELLRDAGALDYGLDVDGG